MLCEYYEPMGLTDEGFVRDVATLLIVVVPAAIGLTLWRIFVTNRSQHQSLQTLALESHSEIKKCPLISANVLRPSACFLTYLVVDYVGPDSFEVFLTELFGDFVFFVQFGTRTLF